MATLAEMTSKVAEAVAGLPEKRQAWERQKAAHAIANALTAAQKALSEAPEDVRQEWDTFAQIAESIPGAPAPGPMPEIDASVREIAGKLRHHIELADDLGYSEDDVDAAQGVLALIQKLTPAPSGKGRVSNGAKGDGYLAATCVLPDGETRVRTGKAARPDSLRASVRGVIDDEENDVSFRDAWTQAQTRVLAGNGPETFSHPNGSTVTLEKVS